MLSRLIRLSLVFLVASLVQAQPGTFTAEARADSLVAALDFERIDAWIDEGTAPADLVAFAQRIGDFAEREPAFAERYVFERTLRPEPVTEALFGQPAVRMQNQFLALAANRDYAEAVVAYEAASFLRTGHLRRVTATLEQALEDGLAQEAAADFAAARRTIASVEPYFASSNIARIPLIRALRELRGRVSQDVAAEEREARFYGQQDEARQGVRIGVGGGIAAWGRPGPVSLLRTDEGLATAQIDAFESTAAFRLGAEVQALIRPALAVGVGGGWSRATYSNLSSSDRYAVDLPVTTMSAYALARLFTRTTVGIRPYVVGGAGVVRSSRGAETGSFFFNADGETFVGEFALAPESAVGAEIRTGAGFEYLSCASCRVGVSAEALVIRSLLDAPLVPDWQVGVGVRAVLTL